MRSREEILIILMNLLSEKFKDHLILKGGMLLRLYQSPRFTQDIDYVWVSKESRKILADGISQILEKLPWLKEEKKSLNSRGVFVQLSDIESGQKVNIEISVDKKTFLTPEPVSTASLSEKYSLVGKIISSMAIAESYSNKIAAAIERDVLRDLYDLAQFENFGDFDQKTLEHRLSQISIHRNKAKKINLKEAADILKKKSSTLTQERIEQELYPLLPQNYRAGILKIIQVSLGRLCQKLAHH